MTPEEAALKAWSAFSGIFPKQQPPAEEELASQQAQWQGQYNADAESAAVQDAYSPFDAVTGGLAGLMTAPVKSFARFAGETVADPFMDAAINYAQQSDNEALKAMFIGKRGMKNLGIDAGQDLAGQFSGLWDKMPRLEIPDNKAHWWGDKVRHPDGMYKAYDDVAGYDDLRDASWSTQTGPHGGSYAQSDSPTIAGREVISVSGADDIEKASIGIHELQHAVQQREGFARGGSPDMFQQKKDAALARVRFLNSELSQIAPKIDNATDPKIKQQLQDEFRATMDAKLELVDDFQLDPMENYQRLAGEIEARDTAARMNMTPEQRQRTQPLSSFAVREDGTFGPTYEKSPIALEDYIVRMQQ